MSVWDSDYDEYLSSLEAEVYEEEYSSRPLAFSNTRVGNTHHDNCSDPDSSWTCCNAMWEADYQTRKAQEAEDLHEEWWQ